MPGYRLLAIMSAGRSASSEYRGDLRDIADLAAGDAHDEAIGLVVGQGDAQSVHAVEGEHGGERKSFVTVDQRVVARQRMQQRNCLVVDVRVGVLAKRRRRGRASADSNRP